MRSIVSGSAVGAISSITGNAPSVPICKADSVIPACGKARLGMGCRVEVKVSLVASSAQAAPQAREKAIANAIRGVIRSVLFSWSGERQFIPMERRIAWSNGSDCKPTIIEQGGDPGGQQLCRYG
ncbi:hypothetical protein ACCAA_1160006 [Candidatus Accumulibacter aalborgensis]|uniref:Uncharacterized protein n=1 Tax=Candidatus Accumulibacter aalborgensis TaxID=1860102 RepID=A0A1A8XHI2_9PROT|nr:hypothetical protein ACCAA_1160006 [Candidatus Accumulibacter aalborgensis]